MVKDISRSLVSFAPELLILMNFNYLSASALLLLLLVVCCNSRSMTPITEG